MTELNLEWNYRHDIWNVVWLPIVFGLNLYFLLVDFSEPTERLFVSVFLLYLILDFIWIWVKPCSVSAPKTILGHHIVSIIGVALIPYINNAVKYAICSTTLVEMNTWFRMLKKVLPNYTFELDILFIVSWVIIRCLLGPYVQFILWLECKNTYNMINNTLFLVGLILNGLSVKWTFDLIDNVKKRYFYTPFTPLDI